MTARLWLRLAEVSAPAIIAISILLAWQADRRDRAQLASQLAAAQQVIAQASTNQKDRDAQLTQTLAQLTAQKNSNLTAAQLLQLLPQALHLPQPITPAATDQATSDQNVGTRFIVPRGDAHATHMAAAAQSIPTPADGTPTNPTAAAPTSRAKGDSLPDKSRPNAAPDNPLPKSPPNDASPAAVLPATDLKPLYDFALDCQACQAKLTASQADLADEKTKSAALTKERDAALQAAKGGSVLRRIARAAKWFALGAAAGAIAAKATR